MQAANAARAGASLPTAQVPGFTTPPQPTPHTYVGTPPPSQSGWGRLSPDASAVDQFHQAQQRMISSRTPAPAQHRPHVIRHNLPISSAATNSAAPIASVTTPTPPPVNSLERFQQTAHAMEQFRQREREGRQQYALNQFRLGQTLGPVGPQFPQAASHLPPSAPSPEDMMRDAKVAWKTTHATKQHVQPFRPWQMVQPLRPCQMAQPSFGTWMILSSYHLRMFSQARHLQDQEWTLHTSRQTKSSHTSTMVMATHAQSAQQPLNMEKGFADCHAATCSTLSVGKIIDDVPWAHSRASSMSDQIAPTAEDQEL